MSRPESELSKATRAALNRSPDRRDWDGVAAVIASFVGLLALCVSGYTAWLQRQQVRAQVWPYLEVGVSPTKREVAVYNKGVGPAIVRSVQIFVDGKAQKNWTEVLSSLGLQFGKGWQYSTINGVVISANDHIDQLNFQRVEDLNAFVKVVKRIDMSICYCSTLNECWRHDDREKDPALSYQPVSACPAKGPDDFIDNENPEPAIPAEETK